MDVSHALRSAVLSAAIRRLEALGWCAADMAADSAALAAAVADQLSAALPAALADYEDARAAGMHEVARATFSASLALAGIAAANAHHAATRGTVPV